MQIVELDIDKITPDPGNPRTTIDEMDLRGMAQSIITEGVINAIEIDKKNVIITGERRWRASKLAGLKTVPVKILEISNEERFMRQVIENVHNNTMTDMDTARSIEKLIKMSFHPEKKKGAGKPQTGVTWAAEKTGCTTSYIEEKLAILRMSPEAQKAVEGGMASTFLRAIRRAPEKFQKEVEEKILNKEFKSADGALNFVAALRREEKNPEVTERLLTTNFSDCKTDFEIKQAVANIAPATAEKLVAQTYEPSQDLGKIIDLLKEWVRNNPRSTWGMLHAPRILANLNFGQALIDEAKHGDEGDTKLLGKEE